MSEQTSSPQESGSRKHKAGLFDIRIIIGALIGIYGVILTIMGFVASEEDKSKADGLNVNLWAGLLMLVGAVVFIAWARLRPIVVPDDFEADEDDQPPGH